VVRIAFLIRNPRDRCNGDAILPGGPSFAENKRLGSQTGSLIRLTASFWKSNSMQFAQNMGFFVDPGWNG